MFVVTTSSAFDEESLLLMLTVVKPTRSEVETNLGWSLGPDRDNYDMDCSYQIFRNRDFNSVVYIQEIIEEGSTIQLHDGPHLVESKSELREFLKSYIMADEDFSPRAVRDNNRALEDDEFDDFFEEE